MLLLLLTCVEQLGIKELSDSVKQEVQAIIKRNNDEPEQRLAEVAAIKEVCATLLSPRLRIVPTFSCLMLIAAVLSMMPKCFITT